MARIMTPATVGVTQGALFSAMRSDMSITAHRLRLGLASTALHWRSRAAPKARAVRAKKEPGA